MAKSSSLFVGISPKRYPDRHLAAKVAKHGIRFIFCILHKLYANDAKDLQSLSHHGIMSKVMSAEDRRDCRPLIIYFSGGERGLYETGL